ncbi:uncharacterized protein FOMMEDRAFT_25302 [Fomitiporia mediterranea MF3/22]|uniref:uncharacterized protein n=1 Tax=Fomitiporia mediterranea (strain MF3/22) TaxID=694068 RepID=UPI0004407C55|nr:uncharacterized protein FOMMEDRAFT_25302 [Fomitiporia mediterranea MF3/22]EJD08133.1 hypothetical protein FOMMEDRAFT_25302 [Fomitiporia mediterranea MF3/22]
MNADMKPVIYSVSIIQFIARAGNVTVVPNSEPSVGSPSATCMTSFLTYLHLHWMQKRTELNLASGFHFLTWTTPSFYHNFLRSGSLLLLIKSLAQSGEMSDIQEGDHVKYAPFHRVADPETANQSTGEVKAVHDRPKKEDPEHKTYTIQNDNTGKEAYYSQKYVTEKLDD